MNDRDRDEETRRREIREHRAERLADEAVTADLGEQAAVENRRQLALALKKVVADYREGWVAVYAGGSPCPDGEPHGPRAGREEVKQTSCWRCDALLKKAGPAV